MKPSPCFVCAAVPSGRLPHPASFPLARRFDPPVLCVYKVFNDVISFDYSTKDKIHGDILISVERVKENARLYNQKFSTELNRVMAHGLLHLLGYKDKSDADAKIMRSKENYYLSKL